MSGAIILWTVLVGCVAGTVQLIRLAVRSKRPGLATALTLALAMLGLELFALWSTSVPKLFGESGRPEVHKEVTP